MIKRFLLITFLATLYSGCGSGVPKAPETVQAIRQLNSLATTEYIFTKTLQATDELTWYKVGERKILINCRAGVKAGVNLETMQLSDVDIDGKKITVQLPPSQLMGINMKPEDITVAYQQTGFFRDKFLPSEVNAVLRVGERQIKTAAAQTDILKQASNNAALLVESALRQMGFEDITVRQSSIQSLKN